MSNMWHNTRSETERPPLENTKRKIQIHKVNKNTHRFQPIDSTGKYKKIQKHKVNKNTPRFQPIDPTGKYKKEESKYMKSTIILPGSNQMTPTGRGN